MNNIINKDKYINPLTDFGFKKLFGTEPNKNLLIDFLNQILPKSKKVADLTYSSTDKLGKTALDRKAIFDLYCQSANGDKFIVEIQKAKQNYFKDRSVYYSTFPIQEQAQRGDWNFKLAAVYTVGVLDFVFEESKKDVNLLHQVQLKDQRNNIFYDKLTYIYIELPKFNKKEEELETQFDKWLFVLKYLAKLEARPRALQEKIFEKVFRAAEIAQFTPKEMQRYQDSLKHYRDIKNIADTSFDEGISVGVELGIEKVAIRMLKAGFSIKEIVAVTGLNVEQIEQLNSEL